MISSLFGPPVDPSPDPGLPAGAPRGREAQRILQAEVLAEWRHYMQSMTEVVARLGGRAMNDTLDARSVIIPASGYVDYSYPVAAGCIEIDNLGTHQMTVVAAQPPGPTAPPSGTGVHPIPAGSLRCKALASRFVTIYGTAGDVAAFQVFTTGAAPRAGLGAVDGGAP